MKIDSFCMVNKEEFEKLSLQDYDAIKQCAYDFLAHYKPGNAISYAMNVLGFQGNEVEYRLFLSTILFPFEQEFCEIYKQYGGQFTKIYEVFPKSLDKLDDTKPLDRIFLKYPNCTLEILEMKAYEIDHFQLDEAFLQGTLIAPNLEKEEICENSEKTR